VKRTLAIMRCSRHGLNAVSIDDDDGGGRRITPSKCCGSWTNVQTWRLGASDWRDIERLAREAAEALKKNHPNAAMESAQ
jgi:hypothetical protein